MMQLIHDPTRDTEFTQTTIDLMFSSYPELVSECGVLPVLISDHFPVYSLHTRQNPQKGGRSIELRCFKDIDNDAIQEDLRHIPWDGVHNCHDVSEAWSI